MKAPWVAMSCSFVLILLAGQPPAVAEVRTWELSGTVYNVEVNGSPSLFPFPVAPGDPYKFSFTFDDSTAGYDIFGDGTLAEYPNAVSSVTVSVGTESTTSDLAATCGHGPGTDCGRIVVSNDSPTYGDSLFFDVSGPYFVQFEMRNPGCPSPGAGVFPPFASTAIPTTAPSVDSFPRCRQAVFGTNLRTLQPPVFDGDFFEGTVGALAEVSSVPFRLEQLLNAVTDVGPGRSLADKVTLAQTYYAVSDETATCSVLTALGRQLEANGGKRIDAGLATELIANAEGIMSTLGCD